MYKRIAIIAAVCHVSLMTPAQQRMGMQRSDKPDQEGSELFAKVKDKLVVIKGETGSGSGSFIRMKDGVWLVTNEHVTRIGHPLAAYTVDGKKVNFALNAKFQVAKNRDMARIKVSDELPALDISKGSPNLGSSVWVFGNSDGGGVLTYLKGEVNGVGDETIEVDATFVQGNSGSPILDDDGNVVGLATYATIRCDPSEWVKADTRFNSLRRFGVRFLSVEWETVSWKTYSNQCRLLYLCEKYKSFLIPICFKDKNIVTDYDVRESRLASRNRRLGKALSSLIRQDKAFLDAKKRYEKIIHKCKTTQRGAIDFPSKESIEMRENALNKELLKCFYERNCALRAGRDILKEVTWCGNRLNEDARKLFEGFNFCVRFYNSRNEVQLNDYKRTFFKEDLSFE